MNLGRVILIVVAIAVAGGAAFLVKYLLDKQRDDAKADRGSGMEAIEVLVADRPLSRGVITTPEHFVWAKWPADKVNPNYIVRKQGTKAADFVGMAVLKALAAGEPVLLPKLLKPGTASFLEAVLKPGMRGFTMRVNTLSNNAGFVLPGIRVDILWSYRITVRDQTGRRSSINASETIRQNIRVLAIGSNLSESVRAKQKAARSKYVTLEVTPKDAEILLVAQRRGRLRLMVRSLKRKPEIERLPRGLTLDREIGKRFGQRQIGSNWVLVAKKKLSVGDFIRREDFEWRPLPPHANTDGLIRRGLDEIQYIGALVKKNIVQGQPIPRLSIILTTENSFVNSALNKGKRAVTLRGIRGNISPLYVSAGDPIDIMFEGTVRYIGTVGNRITPQLAFSEVIVTNARILSLHVDTDSMTVEVNPNDANRLRLAMMMPSGTLSFSVRTPGDTLGPPKFNTDLDVSKFKFDALAGKDPIISRLRRLQAYDQRRNSGPSRFDRFIKVYRANRQSTIVVTE